MLEGIFAEFVHLLAEVFSRLASMRHAWILPVECRYHDHTCRAELACCCDDISHRAVEFSLCLRILSEDEAVEACADGRYLDVTAVESLLDLVHASCKVPTARLEACHAKAFHIVELLVEALAWRCSFLE